jgi:hypothetical protein
MQAARIGSGVQGSKVHRFRYITNGRRPAGWEAGRLYDYLNVQLYSRQAFKLSSL